MGRDSASTFSQSTDTNRCPRDFFCSKKSIVAPSKSSYPLTAQN